MEKQRLSILGSTGSIGEQTLDIVRENPDRLEVVSLTAHRNWQRLAEQAIAFDVDTVVIGDEQYYKPLSEALADYPIKVFAGDDSIAAVASAGNCDTVVNALVGYAGLISGRRCQHRRLREGGRRYAGSGSGLIKIPRYKIQDMQKPRCFGWKRRGFGVRGR